MATADPVSKYGWSCQASQCSTILALAAACSLLLPPSSQLGVAGTHKEERFPVWRLRGDVILARFSLADLLDAPPLSHSEAEAGSCCPPSLRSWRARAAGWRWPLTGPLPENYYARLELLGPKRFSEGRLGRPPPLLLDDFLRAKAI